MSDSVVTPPKWGSTEMLPLPGRFNTAVRSLAAQRFAATGERWKDSVFEREFEIFSVEDARAIEQEALDSGYRFEYSATVSLESEPHKYKRTDREAREFSEDRDSDVAVTWVSATT